MKINEMAASWNRVKVSLGASLRPQRPPQAANLGPLNSMETHEILANCCKSMKIYEMAASWDRLEVSLGASSRPQKPPQAANLEPGNL